MKKELLMVLAGSVMLTAQVGINTDSPAATLDVVGQPSDTTVMDGLIAPRIDGDDLRAKTYTTDQTGALVYVTLADPAPQGQTINVTAPGYYYFNGTQWITTGVASNTSIYTNDGQLSDNRIVTQNGKSLTFNNQQKTIITNSVISGLEQNAGTGSRANFTLVTGSGPQTYFLTDNNSATQLKTTGGSYQLSIGNTFTTTPGFLTFETTPSAGVGGVERMRISSAGNVGIGTQNPSVKLHVVTSGTATTPVPALMIVDGNQKNNYILTTDASGTGTWKPLAVSFTSTSTYTLPANTTVGKYTGIYVDLPNGKWNLQFSIPVTLDPATTYTAGSNIVRFRLVDTNTGDIAVATTNISQDAVAPRIAATGFPLSQSQGTASGTLGINNTSTGTKRYYLYVDNAAGTQRQVTVNSGASEISMLYYSTGY